MKIPLLRRRACFLMGLLPFLLHPGSDLPAQAAFPRAAQSASMAHPAILYGVDAITGTLWTYRVRPDGGAQALAPAGIRVGKDPASLAAAPGGRFLYVANSGSDSISQFRLKEDGTPTPLSPASVAAGSVPLSLTVSPDGRTLYAANAGDRTISQYRISGNGRLEPLSPAAVSIPLYGYCCGPVGVVFDPGGRLAYAFSATARALAVYRAGRSGALRPILHGVLHLDQAPQAIAISSGGDYLYVAAIDDYSDQKVGSLRVYRRAATGGGLPIFRSRYEVTSPVGLAVNRRDRMLSILCTLAGNGRPRSSYLLQWREGTRGSLQEVAAQDLPLMNSPLVLDPAGRFVLVAGARDDNDPDRAGIWWFSLAPGGRFARKRFIPTPGVTLAAMILV